jgi:hypothetical protein
MPRALRSPVASGPTLGPPSPCWGRRQNPVIDPVNAARFMTAASTLKRLARSAALNAPCAASPSRIGTPLGCLDIGSSPVQPGNPNDSHPKRHRDSTSSQNRFTGGPHAREFRTSSGLPRVMQRLCPLSPFSGTISWRAAPSVLEGVRQRTAPGYWQPTAGGRPVSQ